MAQIRISSLTIPERKHIDRLQAIGHHITYKTASRPGFGEYGVADFPFHLIPLVASSDGIPLASKPWLFDISTDVEECFMVTDLNGHVTLNTMYQDFEMGEVETVLSNEEAHELLCCACPGLNDDGYGGFCFDSDTGYRDRDGAPETERLRFPVYDYIESFATPHDARNCLVLHYIRQAQLAAKPRKMGASAARISPPLAAAA